MRIEPINLSCFKVLFFFLLWSSFPNQIFSEEDSLESKGLPRGDPASENVDVNILADKGEFNREIFAKIRSTGKLIKSKLSLIGNKAEVELLDDEYGISPGQACVFYKKDDYGDKLLGGGWIKN